MSVIVGSSALALVQPRASEIATGLGLSDLRFSQTHLLHITFGTASPDDASIFVTPERLASRLTSGLRTRKILYLEPPELAYILKRDTDVLKAVAARITASCNSSEEAAQRLLEVVSDGVAPKLDGGPEEDRLSFPLETLFFQQGDCEDRALLFVALCRVSDIKAHLVFCQGHMCAAVPGRFYGAMIRTSDGTELFFADPFNQRSTKIGEYPIRPVRWLIEIPDSQEGLRE